MKISKAMVTMSILVLTSCYSFNTFNYTNKNNSGGAPQLAQAAPVGTDTTKRTEITCPPFVLPTLVETPELPYKQLSSVSPRNDQAIDAVETEYIGELRDYILKLKKTIRDNHNQYLQSCYDYSEKHH